MRKVSLWVLTICAAALPAIAQPALEPPDPTRQPPGTDLAVRPPLTPQERCRQFGLRAGGAAYADCLESGGEVDPLSVLGDHGLDDPLPPLDLLGNQGVLPTERVPLEGTDRAERQWQYR